MIQFIHVHRPAGQLYLPEAAAKLAARYTFLKHPSYEDMLKPDTVLVFGVGQFQGAQIDEFRIYSDGVAVDSRSNTSILDSFVADLLAWSNEELGVIETVTSVREVYYESSLAVRCMADLLAVVRPGLQIWNDFEELFTPPREGVKAGFETSGFLMDTEPQAFTGRRKPSRFVLERKMGVPFAENIFYSAAPLRTDAHLEFLARIEALASKLPNRRG